MNVRTLVPAARTGPLEQVIAGIASAPTVRPFAEEVIDFTDAVATLTRRHPAARRHPEMLALAFWMRRASMTRLAEEFATLGSRESLLVPRGVAFHIPPANVDTMFVYSLVMSLLVGNRNVVRLSQRRSETSEFLCEILTQALSEPRFAGLREGNVILTYPHDDEISTRLSLAADVRVIWGGDATVERMRALPLKPSAKEIAFADRFSFAALDAAAYVAGDEGARDGVAGDLFNDAYWFDQMGCSSPRMVVWAGEAETAERASQDLWPRLAAVIDRRGHRVDTGAAMAKLNFTYSSVIDRPVDSVRRHGNALTVLRLSDLRDFDRTHPGAGTFFEAVVDRIERLAPFVARKDQTMTAFGFAAEELEAFGRQLNGAGVDRIVAFGEALDFGRFWDGYDLLQELTRRIQLPAPVRAVPA